MSRFRHFCCHVEMSKRLQGCRYYLQVRQPEKKQKTSNKENKDKKPSTSQKNSVTNYFPVLQSKNRSETSGNIHGFDSTGNVTRINTKNPNAINVGASTSSVKKNSSSTIVITKNKTTTKDKKPVNTVNKKIPTTASAQHVLGGATKTKSDDYSAVRNHWLNKFSDKKRASEEPVESENKKAKPEMVSCPVCQRQLSVNQIDGHLDDCLKKQSEEENGECVICGEFYPKSKLEQHISECLKQSFGDDDFNLKKCEICNKMVNNSELKLHLKTCSAKRICPICTEKIDTTSFDLHLGKCVHQSSDVVEEKNSKESEVFVIEDDEEESIRHGFENSYLEDGGEKKYNCPFCFKMFLEKEMCDHLSECVKSQVDAEEELDKSVLIDELSSVDF